MRRVQTYPDGTWSLPVEPEIVTYADVMSVDDYLDRLATVIEPQAIPFARSVSSPFTIPEAMSYLDAVWTARFGQRLFLNVDQARAATLVFTATTPDEFDGRCSALADALSCLAVPADDSLQRKGVRPIVLLGKWLAKRLPESPAARVEEATSTLSRIVNIRVGGQHTADRRKQVEAFQTFGLSYPPVDWNTAWEALRQSATNAIDAIRQEVEANLSHAREEPPTE